MSSKALTTLDGWGGIGGTGTGKQKHVKKETLVLYWCSIVWLFPGAQPCPAQAPAVVA